MAPAALELAIGLGGELGPSRPASPCPKAALGCSSTSAKTEDLLDNVHFRLAGLIPPGAEEDLQVLELLLVVVGSALVGILIAAILRVAEEVLKLLGKDWIVSSGMSWLNLSLSRNFLSTWRARTSHLGHGIWALGPRDS